MAVWTITKPLLMEFGTSFGLRTVSSICNYVNNRRINEMKTYILMGWSWPQVKMGISSFDEKVQCILESVLNEFDSITETGKKIGMGRFTDFFKKMPSITSTTSECETIEALYYSAEADIIDEIEKRLVTPELRKLFIEQLQHLPPKNSIERAGTISELYQIDDIEAFFDHILTTQSTMVYTDNELFLRNGDEYNNIQNFKKSTQGSDISGADQIKVQLECEMKNEFRKAVKEIVQSEPSYFSICLQDFIVKLPEEPEHEFRRHTWDDINLKNWLQDIVLVFQQRHLQDNGFTKTFQFERGEITHLLYWLCIMYYGERNNVKHRLQAYTNDEQNKMNKIIDVLKNECPSEIQFNVIYVSVGYKQEDTTFASQEQLLLRLARSLKIIDVTNSGCVYDNFQEYLNKNETLPHGVMVYPQSGTYAVESGIVQLMARETRSCSIESDIKTGFLYTITVATTIATIVPSALVLSEGMLVIAAARVAESGSTLAHVIKTTATIAPLFKKINLSLNATLVGLSACENFQQKKSNAIISVFSPALSAISYAMENKYSYTGRKIQSCNFDQTEDMSQHICKVDNMMLYSINLIPIVQSSQTLIISFYELLLNPKRSLSEINAFCVLLFVLTNTLIQPWTLKQMLEATEMFLHSNDDSCNQQQTVVSGKEPKTFLLRKFFRIDDFEFFYNQMQITMLPIDNNEYIHQSDIFSRENNAMQKLKKKFASKIKPMYEQLLTTEERLDSSHESYEQFYYNPPQVSWIRKTLETLDIDDKNARLSPILTLSTSPKECVGRSDTILCVEGNCGFRCLSMLLSGNEKYYIEIREFIYEKHTVEQLNNYQEIEDHDSSVAEEYEMTENDIRIFALELKCNVIVYSISETTKSWRVFGPDNESICINSSVCGPKNPKSQKFQKTPTLALQCENSNQWKAIISSKFFKNCN